MSNNYNKYSLCYPLKKHCHWQYVDDYTTYDVGHEPTGSATSVEFSVDFNFEFV